MQNYKNFAEQSFGVSVSKHLQNLRKIASADGTQMLYLHLFETTNGDSYTMKTKLKRNEARADLESVLGCNLV